MLRVLDRGADRGEDVRRSARVEDEREDVSGDARPEDDLLDEAGRESFPASDPPAVIVDVVSSEAPDA